MAFAGVLTAQKKHISLKRLWAKALEGITAASSWRYFDIAAGTADGAELSPLDTLNLVVETEVCRLN
ncbi:hypothetical protein ACI7BZ_05405 [Xanthobacter sp. AM11]|uniref:hypothetical protein n=1 Tax=Xanthobacter sp. AM11 TaxID=3380643 RepID=UPI0039BF15C5